MVDVVADTEITPWIDRDESGDCDPGEAFASFQRGAGDSFHVVVADDTNGDLVLIGHTLDGSTPIRSTIPCPTSP